jgi:hypothetical protein
MDAAHHDVLIRLRAEYLEMPGLRLNIQQVQRLCGIETALCQAVLNDLVASRFLYRRSDGLYARATDGAFPRARPAKADLDAVVDNAKGRRTMEGWK